MEASFTISDHDYLEAMKLFQKITPKIAGLYAIAVAILALTALLDPHVLKAGAWGGLTGGVFVVLPGRNVLNPLQAERHYKNYKEIQEPVTIQLKDEGIRFSTADSGGLIRWERIFKWRQNENYLLIYPMPQLYHIIPKSITDSGFDISSLITLLQSEVGKET